MPANAHYWLLCEKCGVEFRSPPSDERRFCSKPCWYAWRTGTAKRPPRKDRRPYLLMKLYGLTVERYEEMLTDQDGVCAICLGTNEQRLHVDHDHACCPATQTCGKCIRGLLCSACNRILGLARDDPARLLRAVEYLEGVA